jgi:hypothetical protein
MTYDVLKRKFQTNKIIYNKMVFIMNALEQGWKIKKIRNEEDKYAFYKKIDDTNEVMAEYFLESFVNDCLMSKQNIAPST